MDHQKISDGLQTILAAEMQADAAVQASFILSGATVITGICAILAARMVYKSAMRQVRTHELKEIADKTAYRERICVVLDEVKQQLATIAIWAEGINLETADPDDSGSFRINVPEDLESSHWKDHALLPPHFVKKIYNIYNSLHDVRNFLDDIEVNHLKLTDISTHPTVKKTTKLKGGGLEFEWHNVGEQLKTQPKRLALEVLELIEDLQEHKLEN